MPALPTVCSHGVSRQKLRLQHDQYETEVHTLRRKLRAIENDRAGKGQ